MSVVLFQQYLNKCGALEKREREGKEKSMTFFVFLQKKILEEGRVDLMCANICMSSKIAVQILSVKSP